MTTETFTGHVSAMRADAEFLGAEDLMDRGDTPVQITEVLRCVNRKACGKNQSEMFTLKLATTNGPAKKELWLKATNRKQLVKLYGANVSKWKNQWIWLFVEEVKSPAGGMTFGIRIRDRTDAPQQAKKQQPPQEPEQQSDTVTLEATASPPGSAQKAAAKTQKSLVSVLDQFVAAIADAKTAGDCNTIRRDLEAALHGNKINQEQHDQLRSSVDDKHNDIDAQEG